MGLIYLNKCAFMVFSGMILGFIISKEGKLLDPKKIQAIVNMPPPKSSTNSSIQWDGTILYMFYKKIAAIMAPIMRLTKKIETFFWTEECNKA
jgi:hypothetical protein